jgi:hypothetical protein
MDETVEPHTGLVKTACKFSASDFSLHMIFVVFLLAICAIYSLATRREKKNMGEARLLLAASWTLVLLWVGWIPSLLFLPQRFTDVVACAGVLGTATALLFVVYVPKLRMVARLRYDVQGSLAMGRGTKGALGFRNGYSLDTDFLYERPCSLPGTLTSTYSSIRPYPKSMAATTFDSSLSY